MLPTLIFLAGFGQLGVLTAAALVPLRLNWKVELHSLPRLHRQLYWVYGGYIVLAITSFGLLSLQNIRRHTIRLSFQPSRAAAGRDVRPLRDTSRLDRFSL